MSQASSAADLRGDGMAAIFHVVIEQKGNIDPDKTMELLKGWKYDKARAAPS